MHIPSFFNLKNLLAATLFITAGTIALHAQTTSLPPDVPRTISYQGLLASADGLPFSDGRYDITVTLYRDELGREPIWKATYATEVTRGIFNLYLGEGSKPLPGSEAMNAPLWIGTSVNGQEEMRPLAPLAAVPYALNVPDKAITAGKLADGAVTTEKVDMDYISELRIDGQKVSGKGTVLNLVSTPGTPLTYDNATHSLTIGRGTPLAGDGEKGTGALAAQDQIWSANGDGWDLSAAAPYTPGLGDWLGTSTGVDLEFRVNNVRAMLYQQTGTGVPNVIGGDVGNNITAASSQGSIIAEGFGQSITNGDYQTISGGENNAINNGHHNAVAGGRQNLVNDGDHNAVGGGGVNTIQKGFYSTIAGGESNTIDDGVGNFIGGGSGNLIDLPFLSNYVDHAVIAGGYQNVITMDGSVISGGLQNRVESYVSVISGGEGHTISSSAGAAVIAGGAFNHINGSGDASSIGGGHLISMTNDKYSYIGGGSFNTMTDGDYNSIIAGSNNHIERSDHGMVGGGFWNVIDGGSHYSTIAGGEENRIIAANTLYGSIGGGRHNIVQGSYGTIPGGDELQTNVSYAQTAVGFYNAPRGSMAIRPTAAQIAASNDPLFMVGNGAIPSSTRSNAFEVSYNGHTSVYGVNGSGTARPSISGGTFVDNVIYAWGNIPAGTGPAPNPIIPNSDFGVAVVTRAAVGIYDIRITVTNPAGTPLTLNNSSVTATIADNISGTYACYKISATPVGAVAPNTFRVRINNGSCIPDDAPFMFKVTGRP